MKKLSRNNTVRAIKQNYDSFFGIAKMLKERQIKILEKYKKELMKRKLKNGKS